MRQRACVLVRDDRGAYEIVGEPCDWRDVRREALDDGVVPERIEELWGWGVWCEAWRVGPATYFLTSEMAPVEMAQAMTSAGF